MLKFQKKKAQELIFKKLEMKKKERYDLFKKEKDEINNKLKAEFYKKKIEEGNFKKKKKYNETQKNELDRIKILEELK